MASFILLNKTIHKLPSDIRSARKNKTEQLSIKEVNQEHVSNNTHTRKLLSFQLVKTKNVTNLTEKKFFSLRTGLITAGK